jgi:hypothetical protein
LLIIAYPKIATLAFVSQAQPNGSVSQHAAPFYSRLLLASLDEGQCLHYYYS